MTFNQFELDEIHGKNAWIKRLNIKQRRAKSIREFLAEICTGDQIFVDDRLNYLFGISVMFTDLDKIIPPDQVQIGERLSDGMKKLVQFFCRLTGSRTGE